LRLKKIAVIFKIFFRLDLYVIKRARNTRNACRSAQITSTSLVFEDLTLYHANESHRSYTYVIRRSPRRVRFASWRLWNWNKCSRARATFNSVCRHHFRRICRYRDRVATHNYIKRKKITRNTRYTCTGTSLFSLSLTLPLYDVCTRNNCRRRKRTQKRYEIRTRNINRPIDAKSILLFERLPARPLLSWNVNRSPCFIEYTTINRTVGHKSKSFTTARRRWHIVISRCTTRRKRRGLTS